MTTYTIDQVARDLDKTERVVKSWVDGGLVEPDEKPSRGRGNKRKFSEKNLIEFAMIEILRENNVSLQGIKMVLKEIRGRHPDFFTNEGLGIDEELVYIYQHQQEGPHFFYSAKKNEQGSFVVEKSQAFGSAIKNNLSCTMLMLGKIRNKAIKRLSTHVSEWESLGISR